MQQMTTEERVQLVTSKLEEVHALLNYLVDTFGLQYILNVSLPNKNGVRMDFYDLLYSENIDNANLLCFRDQIDVLHEKINIVPNLVKTGFLMVICRDAENPPSDIGQWPQQNGVYRVLAVHRTKQKDDIGDIYCYKLEGLHPNKPYHGYNSRRFQIIGVPELNN